MNKELLLQTECMVLFQSNPYLLDTCRGVAVRLNREPVPVLEALTHLAAVGILAEIGEGEHKLYVYRMPDVTEKGGRL